jgi:hypothetical protein
VTLADFLATWRGLTLENRLHRLAVLGLIETNLITAVALLRADHTVVLVPPVLEGQVSVARESASREVKEAWALYIAELLGKLSPSSAELIQKAVDPLLAPSLRRPVLEVMTVVCRGICDGCLTVIGTSNRRKILRIFRGDKPSVSSVQRDPAQGLVASR